MPAWIDPQTGAWSWAAYDAAHGIVRLGPEREARLGIEQANAAVMERLGRRWGIDTAAAERRYERIRERYWRD